MRRFGEHGPWTRPEGDGTRNAAGGESLRRPRRAGGTRTKAPPAALVALAGARVAIEGVAPEIDGGRFPAKAVAGEPVIVEADIFSDGHDKIDAALLWRRADEADWREAPMAFFDNDRWRGVFVPEANAPHLYTLIAWRDRFESWRDEVSKKHAAGVDIAVELVEGRDLVDAAIGTASGRAQPTGRR